MARGLRAAALLSLKTNLCCAQSSKVLAIAAAKPKIAEVIA
jgi:hypothetical protein